MDSVFRYMMPTVPKFDEEQRVRGSINVKRTKAKRGESLRVVMNLSFHRKVKRNGA